MGVLNFNLRLSGSENLVPMTLHLKINEQIAFPLDRPQLLLDSGYAFVYYVCPPLTRGSLLRLAAAASFPVRCCSVATACRHSPGATTISRRFQVMEVNNVQNRKRPERRNEPNSSQ
jgi:hypothetical protein